MGCGSWVSIPSRRTNKRTSRPSTSTCEQLMHDTSTCAHTHTHSHIRYIILCAWQPYLKINKQRRPQYCCLYSAQEVTCPIRAPNGVYTAKVVSIRDRRTLSTTTDELHAPRRAAHSFRPSQPAAVFYFPSYCVILCQTACRLSALRMSDIDLLE